jgi:ferredoxin-NADP reductase
MAAGVGITTMRALLEDLTLRRGDATLIYRISRPEDAVFRAELGELARRRGARVIYLDGGRASGSSWLPAHLGHLSDVDALRWMVPDVAVHDAYLCGPPSWMDTVRDSLRDAGIPPDHIHIEEFAW